MSRQSQALTTLARISPRSRGADLVPILGHSVRELCSPPSTPSPKSGPSHGRRKAAVRHGGRCGSSTHGLSCAGPGARQDRYGCCPVAMASLYIDAYQQGVSVKAPFLPYFPSYHSVTRFGACPAPHHPITQRSRIGDPDSAAHRCSASATHPSRSKAHLPGTPATPPFGSGFPKKKSPAQYARGYGPKNGRDFFFGASAESTSRPWEQGTSRRFAQECPE
jgi:hypothetical protein